MLIILIISFLLLALLRVPIAFALGIGATVAILLFGDIPLASIPHKMVNGIDSYVFLAIPLFLLAGRLMNAGGITDRIFHFARILVGHIRGGLAHANVVASIIFAWMSGSAVAAVGGLGEIELKAMKKNGFDAPFSASVITASSVLGPIIPPSIPLIIYAAMSENSVGKLFLASVIPGILMALALMILIFILSTKKNYPKDERASLKTMVLSFKEALIPLIMPVIMLGGIAGGFFTPTEAAAVAVLYALVISLFVYKTIKWKDLPEIFVETMVTTAIVTFIISATSPFSLLLTIEDAGLKISSLVTGLTENKYLILFLINILLLVFGALMEAGVVLILFIPILYPLAMNYGIDPIHFGVIMIVNLMIGVATPPMGVCLFVMSHISGLKVEVLMRSILPFLIPMIMILFLITYWPALTTFLPGILMD
ncbi:TRAP transporter large permease [Flexithrix dorotheae]|uniref:TRAP transporter large permease n=1 Tax=Flexithrix dorotheae TaxID=70993 RepID=UPI00036E2B06|nr:TRAP transporter large permease [Flexithrix dorotheae]